MVEEEDFPSVGKQLMTRMEESTTSSEFDFIRLNKNSCHHNKMNLLVVFILDFKNGIIWP